MKSKPVVVLPEVEKDVRAAMNFWFFDVFGGLAKGGAEAPVAQASCLQTKLIARSAVTFAAFSFGKSASRSRLDCRQDACATGASAPPFAISSDALRRQHPSRSEN
ncbi:hypothetical protein Ga0100231_011870 [Opitutaceae bacterium TAV4]|nr:hypothetical protein Ga0100231_011870 [Opitutaceae bacterium TAV4]RRJ98919.1 hypothetical protein Ga0100230_011500 [Opitutaceae bacterium TAV3]